MPKQFEEYEFTIDAFTPDTMPMVRLAEYMADLSRLLGNPESVHFVRLDEGSTVLVQKIEKEAVPKVEKRLWAVKNSEGPPDALKAFRAIDKRLADDNASGKLSEPTGKIVKFPGAARGKQETYGPFNQLGEIDGVLIVVGGELDPVPVHLQEGDEIHICRASRVVAKQLAPHLFGAMLRASGMGRWLRDDDGKWTRTSFKISDFKVLDGAVLADKISALRAIKSPLQDIENPVSNLKKMRHGND